MAEPGPLTSAPPRRLLWAGLALGLILRVLLLPTPGSPDVGSWKIWSFVGASDPASLYGVGGVPPERRLLNWHGDEGTTEYPPLALYEISAAGRVYATLRPAFTDSPLLSALIKSPGLVAEIAFVLALLWWRPRPLGRSVEWVVLAFWLNPAIIINGAGLGYLDAQMAVPATLALIAAASGAFAGAGVLMAVALLTKPQALFLAPALGLLIIAAGRSTRPTGAAPQHPVSSSSRFARALATVVGAGAATMALFIAPIILRGAWANMLQALGRLGAHDMVSGNALNAWWIVTWVVRSVDSLDLGWLKAFTLPVSILGIDRMMEVGYPNPKPIGVVLVCGSILWMWWRVRRGQPLAGAALTGAWCVYTYAMWSAQVHENHAYLAVPVLLIAAGMNPAYRALFWAVSAMTAINMYLFYGMGPEWSPAIDRHMTGIDLSVVLAVINVGLYVWFTRVCLRHRVSSIITDTRCP